MNLRYLRKRENNLIREILKYIKCLVIVYE